MSITVQKKKGESKQELISRFRKMILEAGIIEKIKEKVAYKKPSRSRYELRKKRREALRQKRSYGRAY